MKKYFLFFLLSAVILFTFTSCKKSIVSDLPFLTKDEISAERLWERITKEENYKKYSFWPNHEGFQPGRSPHGRFHKSFINSTLKSSLPIKEKIAPFGSIIIKENYTSDKKLDAFTAMVKVEGYDPENNDWFWAKYKKDGSVEAEGKVKTCIGCHISTRNNDYIILRPLDKKVKE